MKRFLATARANYRVRNQIITFDTRIKSNATHIIKTINIRFLNLILYATLNSLNNYKVIS